MSPANETSGEFDSEGSQVGAKLVLDQPAKSPSREVKRKKHKPVRSRRARWAIMLFRSVLLLYVSLVIGMVLMEERLVYPGAYFKGQETLAEPSNGVETVLVPSTNQVKLPVRWLKRPGTTEVLIFFHGNGSKARWLDEAMHQVSRTFNADVLAAEYRGYEDDVTPTEKGVLEDCMAIHEWVCQQYQVQPEELLLYGRSLGGGCAVATASRVGAKTLILDRTFDRLCDVAAQKYPFIPVRLLMKNRFDSYSKISVYEGPLLQIHGTPDQLIPIEHGRRLFERAQTTSKKFIEVPEMGHNDGIPRSVWSEMADWYAQNIAKTPQESPNAT